MPYIPTFIPNRCLRKRGVIRGVTSETLTVRPRQFELDYDHPLAKGLHIAALRNSPTASRVIDSSKRQNNSVGGTYLYPFWAISSELRRPMMTFNAASATGVTFPTYTGTPSKYCLSFWLNAGTGTQFVIGNGNLNTDRNGVLVYVYASNYIYAENCSATEFKYHAVAFTVNVWAHYVIQFNYPNLYIYRNGISGAYGGNPAGTIISPVMGTYPFALGNDPGSTSYNLTGYLADPMIWLDRTLTDKEIRILGDRSDPLLSGFIKPIGPLTRHFRGVTLSDAYTLKSPNVHVGNGSGRPQHFEINRDHPLAKGLVFAGLGNAPGSARYNDSSAFGNHGTLTAMDPATDWVSLLGRSGLDFVTDDRVVIPHRTSLVMPDKFSVGLWFDSDITNYTANAYLFGPWGYTVDKRQWAISVQSATDKISIMTCQDGTSPTSSNVDTTQSVQSGLHHIQFNATNSTKAWEFYYNGIYIQTITAYRTFAALGSLWTLGGLDGTGNSIDGRIYYPTVHTRHLSGSEISQFADLSNIMLSGMIKESKPIPLAINDRHWVGRTNDWHSADNWSRSQNGRGNAGVPNENTNVFLD